MINWNTPVGLLKSSYRPTLVHKLVTYHTSGNAVDLIKETFDSWTVPGGNVYYACFSPTTEKYPQPEKFSAYTRSISLSWKLQRLSPNTTLLRLQWMNLQHTQEFFCFIFSLKERKNSHRKRNRMKDPYWQLLPRDSTLKYICVAAWDVSECAQCPRIGNTANSHFKQRRDNFKTTVVIIGQFP